MADPFSDAQRQKIIDFIFAGQKISAIKLYRSTAGGDLKGAKDFIDALESSLRVESPEKFQPRAAGCGGSAALILLTPFALYWWLMA